MRQKGKAGMDALSHNYEGRSYAEKSHDPGKDVERYASDVVELAVEKDDEVEKDDDEALPIPLH